MGSRINTVMQPCFFQLADILPAGRGHHPDQGLRREDLCEAWRGDRPPQFRRHRPLAGAPRPRLSARRHQRSSDDPRRARRRARLRRANHVASDGRRWRPPSGERAAGRRHVPDRDGEVREAGDRPDDPCLGSGDLHRLRQVRDGLPPRDDPDEGLPVRRRRGRAGRLPPQGVPLAGPARPSTHDPGRARRLHRLRCLRRRLSRQEQDRHEPQVDQHGAGRRASRRRACPLGLLPVDPAARSQPDPARFGQGQPGPRAPLRVLGGVRRLRRDALHPAGQPALRRPHDRGQRDRLLVDLRRQPADDAMDGQRGRARPGLEQLALRGQRGVRAWDAARARRPDRSRPPAPRTPRPGSRPGPRRRASLEPPRTRRPRSCSSASGSTVSARRSPVSTVHSPPKPDICSRSPAISSARASGSSAATAGPTTSASVGSTRSFRPVAMSTSSSSTPRSTRTPAARRRRRRRAAPWRSSRRPAREPPRRILERSRARTATSTSPRSRWVRTTSRRPRRCSRPMPGRVRRSSSPTAPASPTGST